MHERELLPCVGAHHEADRVARGILVLAIGIGLDPAAHHRDRHVLAAVLLAAVLLTAARLVVERLGEAHAYMLTLLLFGVCSAAITLVVAWLSLTQGWTFPRVTAASALMLLIVLGPPAVFGLLALCVWLVRRGGFDTLGRRGPRLVNVETAVALGDRRQLVIVSVEGRRLLLGLTTAQVTLLTELESGASFDAALDAQVSAAGAAEQQ